MQVYFDQLSGIESTVVGYTGGRTNNPTYDQVLSHTTGHAEAIKITYNPSIISYRQLVMHFFEMHDPTTRNKQGPDIGENYRSAIFFLNTDQEQVAREVRDEVDAGKKHKDPIVTEIAKANTFWPAEEYHQKYMEKHNQKLEK